MPSTALPISGYNMRTHSASYYANGWKVEASSDGLNWELVDIRSNQTFTISAAYYSYDNKSYNPNTPNLNEFFHFTGYRHGGLAVVDPLSIQVDDGATLDLLAFDDGQPVDAITVDLAAGGGTLKGGRIAPNGKLTLVNAAESGANLAEALPLVFEDTLDTENLATWTLSIDGRDSHREITYADGQITLIAPGLMLLVK